MTPLDPPALREHLARDAAAFGEVAAAHGAAPVPWCPGWSVADVALHLGAVHRWAAAVVRSGEVQPEVDGSGDPVAWYAEGWPALLDVLDATDPAAACWGMGPPPRTAAFWWRRQAQETAVHLWDVRTAAGLPAALPDDLALDGVDEALTVFAPRQVRLGRIAAPPVALAVECGGRRWTFGDGEPVATVRGAPADVLLVLWKRRAADVLEVTGDRASAAAVLTLPLVP